MHVLILNQTFHPDVAATGQLMWDVAQHLQKSGHRVTAVTSRYFYSTGRRHALARQTIDGVAIHRIGGIALGKGTHLARLADFASFYAAAAFHLTQVHRPDVVLALTSPPMVATLAMLARQFSSPRVRFVHHIMDLYPDALFAMNLGDPATLPGRILRRITCRTLDNTDAVIVLGRDMRDRLLAVYHGHVKADLIHVIPPWSDGQALLPGDKRDNPLAGQHGLRDTFNVVYSGNLGVAHDLPTMTAAIDATRRDQTLRWVFIGGGMRFDELRANAELARWPHIVFLPFQHRRSLADSLNLADVHLVSQLPSFTGIVVPSKLFGIMAVGKPTLMIGPADAECSRIVAETASGFVVPNGNPGLLIARLNELRQNEALQVQMGRRARAAFEQNYDRDVACAKIEAILAQVVARALPGGKPRVNPREL